MHSILYLAVASVASALVIPDDDVFLEIRSQEQMVLDQDRELGTHHAHLDIDPWGTRDTSRNDQCSVDIALRLGLVDVLGGWDWEHWPNEGHYHRPGLRPARHHQYHHDSVEYPRDDEHHENEIWPGEGHHHGKWPGHRENNPYHNPRNQPYPIHRPAQPYCPPDKTTWDTIQQNERTSRLAEVISQDKHLIELLNNTQNHTIFAPTNQALTRLDHLPPKAVSRILRYHILPDLFPINELLHHQTIATNLSESSLGNLPQRITIHQTNPLILNRRSIIIEADMVKSNPAILPSTP